MRYLMIPMLLAEVVMVAVAQTPAFPGADGFGKYVGGGRGGKVIFVTNLNDDGPGSLRAVLREQGARTIIFRVSGTIKLKSELVVNHDSVTVAGQTAPGDGICVSTYPVIIAANNVILRFVRFRLGDEARLANDALTGMGARDVIIDHCSMSWGIDEVGSFYDNENFTLQWSIISESLYNSYHPKGPHGFGGIWGGSRVSFHHNLLAHHSSRNPRFNGSRTRHGVEELVDFRNNVVYNWGFSCAYGGEGGRQNVVANYFKPGPATLQEKIFLEPWDAKGKWFVADNYVVGSPDVSSNNWAGGVAGAYGEKGRVIIPFAFIATSTQKANDAYEEILKSAGATLPKRDAVDVRIVSEAHNGTATYGTPSYAIDHKMKPADIPRGIVDSQRDVGGWPQLKSETPPVDSDRDGIPDEWERDHKLNPFDPNDGKALTESGYTNLDLYLNQIGVRDLSSRQSHQQ